MRPARRLILALLAAAPLHAATVNSPAPSFTLPNTRHETTQLAHYRGKTVLINFWASWCAPCLQELPELNRLAEEYKGKNVKVLAINVDEDRAAAQKLLKKLGISAGPIEILWDNKSKVVSTYDIPGMPSSFIVDPHGKIRFTHVGFHPGDPAAWRQEIASCLAAH